MNYPSIRVEGAILSSDLLDRLDDAKGQGPADFGLDPASKVKDEIARAWADAQDYWRIFQRKTAGDESTPLTTEDRKDDCVSSGATTVLAATSAGLGREPRCSPWLG